MERLKIIAKDGNMPHVIISGMPGIGKTTSILCLARQLLGDAYKEAVLELNASDERGKRSRKISIRTSLRLTPTPRHRRRPESHKSFRPEESHFASRPPKASHSRRSRQHDIRRSTGSSPYHGNLLLDYSLRLRMQCLQQDHRASSISLCHPPLRPPDRCSSRRSPDADM